MFSGGNVKALASPQRSQIIMDFAPSNSLSLFLILSHSVHRKWECGPQTAFEEIEAR